MTVGRMVGLLAALAMIGIAVVGMRVDQARYARQIQELGFRQTELRQTIWQQEMMLARLRSPQMIRERAARLGVGPRPAESGEVLPAGR